MPYIQGNQKVAYKIIFYADVSKPTQELQRRS